MDCDMIIMRGNDCKLTVFIISDAVNLQVIIEKVKH